ncbi:3-oxoacyl-[acyl-carrier-protein] synthase, mitochondrial-like protein [Corchorus olitorius]|uniref:3-oxoacyl-[acyl-carrier-protein] synthase, mitochondrial-like protein n=1 Tax=Corchorus olitorius TaxID=93759 RepID=A0A1R3G5L5_9ROSI|nr:3-oxoacyl-[acyl-carrier-protein] synthase, mitochondrial-like protein [Corchorus olitorius]
MALTVVSGVSRFRISSFRWVLANSKGIAPLTLNVTKPNVKIPSLMMLPCL